MAATNNTPLHTAAVIGDAETVNTLLASGVRPDVPNNFGRLPEDVTSSPAIAVTLKGTLLRIPHIIPLL